MFCYWPLVVQVRSEAAAWQDVDMTVFTSELNSRGDWTGFTFGLFPVQGKVEKDEKLNDLEHLLCMHVAQAKSTRVRAHRRLDPLATFCFRIGRAEKVSLTSSTNHGRREEPVITASLWNHTVIPQNVFVHLKAVTRTQSDRMKRKRLVGT